MAYDIFTGIPLNQSIQGAAFDEGGVTWGNPTYLDGDGANAVKISANKPQANVIVGNFLPPDGAPKIRVFFKSGASRPAAAHSLQLAMHCDGSVSSQYTLNGVRAGAPGYGFLQLWDVAANAKVEIAASTTNGNEYCLEVECLNQAAGQYRARLYNSTNGTAGTLIATTPTLTLATPRASTAKMAQIWGGGDTDLRITRVETEPTQVTDTTGPVLEAPTATATGANSATGTVGTNEAGGTLYRLASTNASGVTAATIKAANKTQPVNATGQQTVNETGLTSGTTYYMWYYQEDTAGNPSNVVVSSAFTTPAVDSTSPTFAGGAAITPGTITSSTLAFSYPAATDNVAVTGYQKRINGGTWEDNGTGLSGQFSGLSSNTPYTIEVRAKDAAGNFSTALSITMTTSQAATGTFTTYVWTSSGTIRSSQAFTGTWYSGGAPGTAGGTATLVSGTLSSGGVATITVPKGSGFFIGATADGGRYYQEGTVT